MLKYETLPSMLVLSLVVPHSYPTPLSFITSADESICTKNSLPNLCRGAADDDSDDASAQNHQQCLGCIYSSRKDSDFQPVSQCPLVIVPLGHILRTHILSPLSMFIHFLHRCFLLTWRIGLIVAWEMTGYDQKTCSMPKMHRMYLLL